MNKTKIKLVELPDEFEIYVTDKEMTWQEAMDYAESIDMRLPTKFELQAIAESTDEFNHLGWFWSSSSHSVTNTGAWAVYLNHGDMFSNIKSNSLSVICVSTYRYYPTCKDCVAECPVVWADEHGNCKKVDNYVDYCSEFVRKDNE